MQRGCGMALLALLTSRSWEAGKLEAGSSWKLEAVKRYEMTGGGQRGVSGVNGKGFM